MENDQTEAEIDETIEERISNTSQHSDENGKYFGTKPTYYLGSCFFQRYSVFSKLVILLKLKIRCKNNDYFGLFYEYG